MVYFYRRNNARYMRVIWENVRGQMVVRVNGNSEHYNSYAGNKSLPGPLSRVTYASTGGNVARRQRTATHFWRSFELYRFLSTRRKGYRARVARSPRDGKIRKPSARISAALICFVCIARYANTKRRATKRAQWRIKVQKDARKFRLTNRAT